MYITTSISRCFGGSGTCHSLLYLRAQTEQSTHDDGKSRGSESMASVCGKFTRLLDVFVGDELGKAMGDELASGKALGSVYEETHIETRTSEQGGPCALWSTES